MLPQPIPKVSRSTNVKVSAIFAEQIDTCGLYREAQILDADRLHRDKTLE
jgi:hypothetical protein